MRLFVLLEDQQKAHLELFVGCDAVQSVFLKPEALAGGQFVVMAFVADGGLAVQRGQNGVAGGAVRGQARSGVKSHQHELHVVGADKVEVGDAALFVRDEVLQVEGLAGGDDVVHSDLLFWNDFGVDESGVRLSAAERLRRNGDQDVGRKRNAAVFFAEKQRALARCPEI